MSKARWLLWLNPLLFASLIIQALTGAILFFSLLSSLYELAAKVHAYNGLVFVILALTHLTLNWSWVKANFFKKATRVPA